MQADYLVSGHRGFNVSAVLMDSAHHGLSFQIFREISTAWNFYGVHSCSYTGSCTGSYTLNNNNNEKKDTIELMSYYKVILTDNKCRYAPKVYV